jgi:hypothetical protein
MVVSTQCLRPALIHALVGISTENSVELKRTVGNVMGEVVSELINPAIRTYPELEVDEATRIEIAKAQVGLRYNNNNTTDC